METSGEQGGAEEKHFYEALGVSSDDVPETSSVDDSEAELSAHRSVKLYRISDASGSLKIEEVSGMPLTQDMLEPEVRNFSAEISHPTFNSRNSSSTPKLSKYIGYKSQ